MRLKRNGTVRMPSTEELEEELSRVNGKIRYRKALKNTLFTLITVAALAVLVSTLWLPVLQIYGNSMTPTLKAGEILLTVKHSELESGEVVAFYYNNKILVKRVIANAGEWVDIDPYGNVFVDGRELSEPYLSEPDYGDTNIQLPYQVPDGKIFVMGDHRETSLDSRNTAIGCVSEEQIIGKIIFRIWPLSRLGGVE